MVIVLAILLILTIILIYKHITLILTITLMINSGTLASRCSASPFSVVSGIFRRIITFPLNLYLKSPMEFQRHVPMEFPFLRLSACNTLP